MLAREPKRVLIADDNPVSRSMLRLVLLEEGYVAIGEATNGLQAIEMAQRLLPDIVCLDITMPGADGMEALAEIRRKSPAVTILMVTSHADRPTVEAAISGGANGYILKPFTSKAVLQAIRESEQDKSQESLHGSARFISTDETDSLHITIIEDDAVLLKLYALTLSNWPLPVRIESAPNGYEGLLKLRNEPPAMLICDLNLPKVNGFQIIRSLSGMKEYQDTKIVAVSGMPPEEIDEKGGLPDGVELMGKPIEFSRLLEIARNVSTGTDAIR